jgi:hypothetical protein
MTELEQCELAPSLLQASSSSDEPPRPSAELEEGDSDDDDGRPYLDERPASWGFRLRWPICTFGVPFGAYSASTQHLTDFLEEEAEDAIVALVGEKRAEELLEAALPQGAASSPTRSGLRQVAEQNQQRQVDAIRGSASAADAMRHVLRGMIGALASHSSSGVISADDVMQLSRQL